MLKVVVFGLALLLAVSVPNAYADPTGEIDNIVIESLKQSYDADKGKPIYLMHTDSKEGGKGGDIYTFVLGTYIDIDQLILKTDHGDLTFTNIGPSKSGAETVFYIRDESGWDRGCHFEWNGISVSLTKDMESPNIVINKAYAVINGKKQDVTKAVEAKKFVPQTITFKEKLYPDVSKSIGIRHINTQIIGKTYHYEYAFIANELELKDIVIDTNIGKILLSELGTSQAHYREYTSISSSKDVDTLIINKATATINGTKQDITRNISSQAYEFTPILIKISNK